jgi:hypothetical protein
VNADLLRVWTAWDRWWFAPTKHYQIGVFRVILVAWVGWFYSERFFSRLEAVQGRPQEFFDAPSLAVWLCLPLPVSDAALNVLRQLALPLVLCALFGLCTRASLLLLAALNLILGLTVNAWGYAAHASALPAVVLFLIGFAPGVTSFSLDALIVRQLARMRGRPSGPSAPEVLPTRPVSIWPVRAVLVFLCLLYFTAGLSKIRYAGASWADGKTLAFYLAGGSLRGGEAQRFFADPSAPAERKFRDGYGLVDYAYVGRPTSWGYWLAEQPLLLRILAATALLWELLFPLALLGRRPRHVALLMGIGFHFGIGVSLRINFSSYLVCYALFVNWSSVTHRLRALLRLPSR